MLYHLLAPLGKQYLLFNLFNYISFRAGGATITALLIAFVFGPAIIRRLRTLKVGQIVRAEGPATHLTKQGTPTMGGLIILLATIIPTVLWARLDNAYVLITLGALIWFGAIGFLDDYLKVVQKKSRGLIARWKLVGQVGFGALLATVLVWYPVVPPGGLPATSTTLPFFKSVIVIFSPFAYAAFVTFVVTAFSNAVNLTDGLDGLAAGLATIAAAAFAFFAYVLGRVDTTQYLNLHHLPGAGELAIFCTALLGGTLGFLWFNAHPAEVFMGDTGSLAIGGALGTISILLKAEFLFVLIGGVFVAEAVSVVLQTSVYKWHKNTHGKAYADAHKVFRMAPLHHHFEKKGWAEPTVVTRFYILGICCALLGLATLKLR